LNDLESAGDRGWYLDARDADRLIAVMQCFKHTKGSQWAGKPFVLSDSQRFIAFNVFGWKCKEKKLRRFRKCYMTVARKWGKSTFISALAAALFFADHPVNPQAEFYCTATKEDQAKIVHTQVCKMIETVPELAELATSYKCRDTYKSIVLNGEPFNGSKFIPLGNDSRHDGYNISFVVKDELHEWREHHRQLKDKIETGGGSQMQPLDVTITTAGSEKSTLWIQDDEYACRVLEAAMRDEEIDDRLFAFIARLDENRPCPCGGRDSCETCGGSGEIEGDDPLDSENWAKGNPDIGTTPSWEYIQEQANRAKNDRGFLPTFERYHLNRRVRSNAKIIDPNKWNQCAGQLSEWKGNAFGAWDIGWRDDLASIAAVFPSQNETGAARYELRQVSFCPSDGRRDLKTPVWQKWIQQGRLIVTPGDTTDLLLLKRTVIEWAAKFGVYEWSFDPANSLQLALELQEEHGFNVTKFPQTYTMFNEPIREFRRCVAEGEILHDGDPLLTWAVGNLAVKKGSRGELMPDKENSEEKIDPAVAGLMAFGRCLLSPKQKPSVYKQRGILTI